MSEIVLNDPLVTLQNHPHEPGMKIFVSQRLEAMRDASLCRNCAHRDYGYERCEIAMLLFDLAKKTGVSTMVRWCPYVSVKKF